MKKSVLYFSSLAMTVLFANSSEISAADASWYMDQEMGLKSDRDADADKQTVQASYKINKEIMKKKKVKKGKKA